MTALRTDEIPAVGLDELYDLAYLQWHAVILVARSRCVPRRDARGCSDLECAREAAGDLIDTLKVLQVRLGQRLATSVGC
jgi:hypothetical protein